MERHKTKLENKLHFLQSKIPRLLVEHAMVKVNFIFHFIGFFYCYTSNKLDLEFGSPSIYIYILSLYNKFYVFKISFLFLKIT